MSSPEVQGTKRTIQDVYDSGDETEEELVIKDIPPSPINQENVESKFKWQGGRPTSKPAFRRNSYISTLRLENRRTISRSFSLADYSKEEAYKKASEWILEESEKLEKLRNCWRETENKDVIEIRLTYDKVTKIDRADFELVKDKIWSAHYIKTNNIYYASAGKVRLHRFLTGFKNVGHFDSDTLNNCRSNLYERSIADSITRPRGLDYYIVHWIEDGKRRTKPFAWETYGSDGNALQEAKKFRFDKVVKLALIDDED